jgi:hypothetical protein
LPERSAGSGHNRPIVGRGNSLTISGCRRHQHTRGEPRRVCRRPPSLALRRSRG